MTRVTSYAQGTPSYIELATPDQQAAKNFYGPLFGWDFRDVDMGDAGVYVAVTVGGDSVAGIAGQLPERAGGPASWNVYLTVDDVDVSVARVEPAGGRVTAGPFDVMQLGRSASIEDPTGVRVHLWQAGASVGSARVNEPGCPIWHELTSHDLATATAFYADVLGVTWEAMAMEGGDDYTCLMVAGRPVGGAFPPPRPEIPSLWEVYLNVEDCDATAAQATTLGGSVLQPPWDVPGVGRLAILHDPRGAVVGLMQNPSA